MSTEQYIDQAIGFLKANPNTAVDFLTMVGAKKPAKTNREKNNQIFHEMKKEMVGSPREMFMVFAIGRDGNILDHTVMFSGLEHRVELSLRSVFRWLMTRDDHVTEFVIAHNHPYGKAEPSIPDMDLTYMVRNYAAGLGLSLSDHFVLGVGGEIISIRQHMNENIKRYGTHYGKQYLDAPGPHDNKVVKNLFSDADFIMEQLEKIGDEW